MMTVKELKEKLNKFDDNLYVCVPNIDWDPLNNLLTYTHASVVVQGVNELDSCLFIEGEESEVGK